MTAAAHHRLTPTQQQIIDRHLAFKEKIASLAKTDRGISCPSASCRTSVSEGPPPVSAEKIAEWAERQRAIPIPVSEPAEPWFSIVEMGPPPPITIKHIIGVVARECNLTRNDILSERRLAQVVRARQIAMYWAKELTGFSFPALGRQFGYRDHTTVLHGVRKIERLRSLDADLNELLQSIGKKIKDEHNARYAKATT